MTAYRFCGTLSMPFGTLSIISCSTKSINEKIYIPS